MDAPSDQSTPTGAAPARLTPRKAVRSRRRPAGAPPPRPHHYALRQALRQRSAERLWLDPVATSTPQHAALGARLMRPRRAARPPAAPAGSVPSTIGPVAHRGEDPPHDGAIAADSVRRVVIIRPPASRS